MYLLLVLVICLWNSIASMSPYDPESLCNSTDLTTQVPCIMAQYPRISEVSKAVLRLRIAGRGYCSGWLVGNEGHILTNWHCIRSKLEAHRTTFEAMAQGRACGIDCSRRFSCRGPTINRLPVKFLITGGNLDLDFTLVQLHPSDCTNFVKSLGNLKIRSGGPCLNERIYIPQHPGGSGKRVALFGSTRSQFARIASAASSNFNGCGKNQVAYVADTQGGSSGSPVVAVADHAVVALHHCGGCSTFANSGVHVSIIEPFLRHLLPSSAFSPSTSCK